MGSTFIILTDLENITRAEWHSTAAGKLPLMAFESHYELQRELHVDSEDLLRATNLLQLQILGYYV